MRYMLLPYFYTLFREANTSGVPVARPLWMEFPSDEATFSNDEAFMVGNSLLVQGIYTEVCQHVDFHCIDLYCFLCFSSPSSPTLFWFAHIMFSSSLYWLARHAFVYLLLMCMARCSLFFLGLQQTLMHFSPFLDC